MDACQIHGLTGLEKDDDIDYGWLPPKLCEGVTSAEETGGWIK